MVEHITKPQLQHIVKLQGATIYYTGYCDLQHLTNVCDRVYYNAGVFGWNYDVFILPDDNYLVTGYRVPSTIGIKINHDIARAIDEHARYIQNNSYVWYEAQKEIVKAYNEYYKKLMEV